jgi:hypothetical protein
MHTGILIIMYHMQPGIIDIVAELCLPLACMDRQTKKMNM